MFPLLLAAAAFAAEPSAIEVVSTTRNSNGHVLCSLFSGADGFPGDPDKALKKARAKVSEGRATCRFEGVVPGTYAVATMHDEDDDLKMNTNLVGIPKEGFGASKDAPPGLMGPPSYEDAAFTYEGGTLKLAVNTRYYGGS